MGKKANVTHKVIEKLPKHKMKYRSVACSICLCILSFSTQLQLGFVTAHAVFVRHASWVSVDQRHFSSYRLDLDQFWNKETVCGRSEILEVSPSSLTLERRSNQNVVVWTTILDDIDRIIHFSSKCFCGEIIECV